MRRDIARQALPADWLRRMKVKTTGIAAHETEFMICAAGPEEPVQIVEHRQHAHWVKRRIKDFAKARHD
jgi:hypothetical protein